MVGDYLVLFLLFIVIIICVVLCILWSKQLSKPYILPTITETLPTEAYSKTDIGSRCISDHDFQNGLYGDNPNDPDNWIPRPCKNGLTCVKSYSDDSIGICRVSLGGPCSSIYQCTPEAISCSGSSTKGSGICSNGNKGSLFQSCFKFYQNSVCSVGLQCNNNVCLYKDGMDCEKSYECNSGVCDQNICKTLVRPGGTCSSDFSSDSNICVNGYGCDGSFCQPVVLGTPKTTGTVDSICYRGSIILDDIGVSIFTPSCNVGLICSGQLTGERAGMGTCLKPVSGLFQNCSDTIGCFSPLICNAGVCTLPDNPNNCDLTTSGICSAGFICSNLACLARDGLICQSSSDCESSTCTTWKLNIFNPALNIVGTWTNSISLPVNPSAGSIISVYQISPQNLCLYFPTYGNIFYLINLTTSISRQITLHYSTSITQIKKVKLTPGGKIAIHVTINTFDKIFIVDIPLTYGSASSIVTINDSLIQYNGIATINDFDIDDTYPLETRFIISSGGQFYSTLVEVNNIGTLLSFDQVLNYNHTPDILRFYAGTELDQFYFNYQNTIIDGNIVSAIVTLSETIDGFTSGYDFTKNRGEMFIISNKLLYHYNGSQITVLPGKVNNDHSNLTAIGNDHCLYMVSTVC